MRMLQFSRLLGMAWASGLCVVTLAAFAARPQPPIGNKNTPLKKPQTANGLTIGDVSITDMLRLEADRFVDFTIYKKPDRQIRVESSDKTASRQILIFADHIVAHKRTNNGDLADLTGNVHYTINDKDANGAPRVLDGRAQRVIYRQNSKTIRLTGGVDATLKDASKFDGPATLHVSALSALGEGRYELTADPSTADMRFTPSETAAASAPKPGANSKTPPQHAARIGSAHISGFKTGHIQEGQEVRFEGPLVTVETVRAAEKSAAKTQNTLKAPQITALLGQDQERVEGKGGIQFDNRTTDAKGHAQRLEGTASTAYWSGGDAPRLEADGSISAKLTNTLMLREPAALTAGHLTANLGDEPHYVVTGSPDRTRFAFNPRRKQGKRQKAKGETNAPITSAAPVAPAANKPGTVIPAQPAAGNAAQGVDAANKPKTDSQDPNVGADPEPQDDADATPDPNAQDPTPNTPNAPFVMGSIVVSAFQTATYVPGESVVVEGPMVHFTSTDRATKNNADLKTPKVVVQFDEDNAIAQTQATGGVTYRFEQPVKNQKVMQWIAGEGRDVTYANSDDAQTVIVAGVTNINYFNPLTLAEPTPVFVPDKNGTLTYNLTTGHIALETANGFQGKAKFLPPVEPPHTADTKKKPKRK